MGLPATGSVVPRSPESDSPKSRNSSSGIPAQRQLGSFSPLYRRNLFECLRVIDIKFGKLLLAWAPTWLPAEYVQESQYQLGKALTVHSAEIKRILYKELAHPIDTTDDYIDPTPIAPTSTPHLHATRFKGAQADVVIKNLKPGIEDVLVADINFIYVVARIVEFLNPDPSCSRASLFAIVNGSLLTHGSFHVDLHPGNLWLLREDPIEFLDFGIVGPKLLKTVGAMEVLLGSITTEEFESMAFASIEMQVRTAVFAKNVFDEMQVRTVATGNSLRGGYC
ncbi:hypothetical protein L2E82_15442 [Cichorium intybus]|uniref:Uncharacterized protein n=1 Tax=Cichorium intybus TaxID=13427 RepID=A0ACB9F2U4_CICIN|nr:hypothetical protein L2E82_15442 [Cichorium intybus]